tara:strand:- start:1029 stop:1646 length:618 start_codon:yes stop_codon:yes gene_type:complete
MNKKRVKITPHNVEYDLDITNPYLKHSIQPQGSLITFNDITIPNETFVKALELEKITCNVRVICFCDIFMSIYYFDVNFIIGIFSFLVSFNGYLSTINYKTSYLACYLWYQYVQLLVRFIYLLYVFFYYLYSDNVYNQENNTITEVKNETTTSFTGIKIFAFNVAVFDCLLVTCMFIMQIFITYYIHRFNRLLPRENDYDKINFE